MRGPDVHRAAPGRRTHEAVLRDGRQGMTLVELMVALTLFGVIISVSLSFLAQQNSAFQTALERLGALRGARYAVTTLAQDLETLGTNVPRGQPPLLYADSMAISFSADYATNVAGDPFAVFHDPGVPAGLASAPTSSFVVPNTGVTVADSVYRVGGGVVSPAELLTFFFEPDSTTARTDDFILYRQVNGGAPEVVARHLLRDGGQPFLSYEKEAWSGGVSSLAPVAAASLPIHHSAPFHLSPADTGSSALADSIRVVRVALVATNGLSDLRERSVRISRRIALPNAGLEMLSTCGSAPIFGDSLSVAPTTLPGGEAAVDLSWGQAVDEAGGESDVVRYVLWRRAYGAGSWGEPYLAVPAGAPSYSYTDATVESGGAYEFAIAAQDCTPSLSSLHSSGLVVVP